MKNIIIAMIGLLSITQTSLANEDITRPMRRFSSEAQLTRFTLGAGHEYLNNIDNGYLSIDHVKKTIHVALYSSSNCPQDVICIMEMPAPIVIQVPLLHVEQDNCGSIEYSGFEDARPRDGMYESLTVLDHSRNRCPHFVALPATEVIYNTITPGFGSPVESATSFFYGDALRHLN